MEATMKKNTLKPFGLVTLAFSGLSLLGAVATSAAVIQFHQQIQLPPARPAPQPASRPAAQPAPQRQSQPSSQHPPVSQHQSQPEPQHQPKPAQRRPSAAAPQKQQ